MALKSGILQLYHIFLKLDLLQKSKKNKKLLLLPFASCLLPTSMSLVLTIGGEYLCSNSAAAQTNFTESRGVKINSNSPILQAQIFPEPVPLPPPTSQFPTAPVPPPPTIDYGVPLGGNTLDQRGFPNLRYAVYVNGDSPWLLKIIREIESKAVLRKYQNRRVIQVGSFSDRFFAEDLANFFDFQGIKAQIVRLNSGEEFGRAVAGENTDLFPPVVQPIDYGLGEEAYYVLIPGQSRNLPAIREQVLLLGMPPDNIFFTEVPANVAVGPFYSEADARGWQRYLQATGGFRDAELYFGR